MEEKKKLPVIIHHWIEHNESHMAEYQKWAEKAGQLGLTAVSAEINAAVEKLLQCNHCLQKAMKEV